MSAVVGATRNRTDLFIKYRKHAKATARPISVSTEYQEEGATNRLLAAESGGPSHSIEMSGSVPPRYVDFKEQIRTEMFLIKQKMNDLRQLHGRAALTSFDDSESSEAEIEVITQDITRLFRKCEARLQHFTAGEAGSESDEKVKQNVQRTLAIELQKLSVQFRKQQKVFLKKLSQKDGVTLSPSSLSVLDDNGPSNRGGGEDEYDRGGFSDMQAMRVETMSAFAEERDREVRNILQSIGDLTNIMRDLSTLVIDQGTILDRIDYNMEQVATSVEEGVKELTRAEKSQKQSRVILCIMFLLVAVIVMVFIVTFKEIIVISG